jgi:transposase-like protein
MKYTINQFRKEFPTEEACLDKVFKLNYSDLKTCPKCNEETSFRRITTRRCYQCTKCYHQIYPCANTIFEKSRTPLMYWFYAMFLFTTSINGLSACELERHLGVTYKTAWRMLKHIRILLNDQNNIVTKTTNTVELDETYIGGKNKNRHSNKKFKHSQGRSIGDKTPVFGILERGKGMKAFVVDNTQGSTLKPIIYKHIETGSIVMTDEWVAYKGLNKFYNHSFVEHGKRVYVNGDCTTNRAENFWSNLKRTLGGSYISVSKKYLQL